MQDIVHKKGKVYYSMGEVAEMFDVNPSLLRYWESEFDVLKPHRNKKGNRLFTPQDVDNLKVIYHLLKEKKMKIEVARKHIKESGKEADRDAVIVEKLMSIRSMLQQIKQDVLHGVPEDDNAEMYEEDTEVVAYTSSAPVAEADGEVLAPEEELTLSEIIASEAADAEKLPFKEQMLFDSIDSEDNIPTLASMIDSFIAKNANTDSDSGQTLEHDPFAAFAEGSSAVGGEQEEQPKQTVIEQTLF
jgi:DNA-binding transcriptional MerR regulator